MCAPCSKRDKRPLEVLYKEIRAEQPCQSCKNGDNPNASRTASTHQGNTNRYVSPGGLLSNRVQTVDGNYLAPPQDHHRNPAARSSSSSSRNAGREGGGSGRSQVSSRQFVADQDIERGAGGTAGRRATGSGSCSQTAQVIERAKSQSASRRTGGGGGGSAPPVQPIPTIIERASSSSASRRTATGGGGGQLELFDPRNQGYHGYGSARSASGTSTQRYVNDANGQLVPVQEVRRGGTVVPSGSSSSSSRNVAPHVSGNVHSGSSSSGAHHIRINIEISYYSSSSAKH
ncbi:hypothetical protein H2204_000695 [Knufia peltigerae]|uniref:Uncharacterized protein n=1 Tax=Knufia peltigerae TaxID=1002370 RepID=A0AA38YDY2_9EURO|nr:hypothetical protein H2204_000695 [Knufia peltigerae]